MAGPSSRERFAVARGRGWIYRRPMADPKKPSKKKPPGPRAVLLGVGLDSDGHQRVTKGKNFALVGGTQETHEAMTEKAIKINEHLEKRGKELHEVSREEFDDIAHKVGLRRDAPEDN
jgi:hypothetical protein